ncbi:MAG TPA: polysaccharide biosynthesis/export family protein, partial [Candidatus Saccharimonadales bacterium]|nr:polysaccharide biosynthesis/export family protein [Candidatus Saccharimonadales bacterium]
MPDRSPSPTALLLAALLVLGAAGPCLAADSSAKGAEKPAGDSFLSNYKIGVEDVLNVNVWKNPDLSITVPVRPDGRISLPLIGDVQAAGLTPMELKDRLTEMWKTYLSAPAVSVIVTEINSFKVYLVGEVARPGEQKLKNRTTLLQAVSLAGGFTQFAKSDKVVLLRREGDGEKRYKINV